MTTYTPETKLAFIAKAVDHISVNKWLVQLSVGNKWYTAYFADPPKSPVPNKFKDEHEALDFVLNEALRDAETLKKQKDGQL